MPKMIESPHKGTMVFSKSGGLGGLYSNSNIRFNRKENNEIWSWLKKIPCLLWYRMHKMVKKAFKESSDERYAFIFNHIKHETEETILQVLDILKEPAYSFEKIYKQLSERLRPTIVIMNIIIDFLGEPGKFCYDDWTYRGQFRLKMQSNLLDHKEQILKKFIKMREILFDNFKTRVSSLFSLIALICFCIFLIFAWEYWVNYNKLGI